MQGEGLQRPPSMGSRTGSLFPEAPDGDAEGVANS